MSYKRVGDMSRRGVLECMAWAGAGVVWTVSGGVPKSSQILGVGEAKAAEGGFSFLQISDTHIGFAKPANPNAAATAQEAVAKINALSAKPEFLIHTGDITHLAKPGEFDDADQIIGKAGLVTHYVPGEHDVVDENSGKAYFERYAKKSGGKGWGWYSFDHSGVHFVALVNVVELKKNGAGSLGADQLAWLTEDLKGKSHSTPIVVFTHIPLWAIYPEWGWSTEDSAQALKLLKPFGSVTVLNGHIHQIVQKVEGRVTFHTARSTAFPQPEPGKAPTAGPMLVPADKLRSVLGVTDVVYSQSNRRLATTDVALSDG
ncbi:metallophosphoesterase family protein [Methylocapsa aurea]|uniref:metallophosphoesterase family protein n=1 Tax=Methylocapsa aurea TaxID=663610 RepID=UPI00056CAA51|nr:metallophosphoesterase [Methylocapsa aurea]